MHSPKKTNNVTQQETKRLSTVEIRYSRRTTFAGEPGLAVAKEAAEQASDFALDAYLMAKLSHDEE